MDKPVKKSNSTAFEVILKPAASDSPLRPISPPKLNRVSLSQEDIKLKLQKAEERRQVCPEMNVKKVGVHVLILVLWAPLNMPISSKS